MNTKHATHERTEEYLETIIHLQEEKLELTVSGLSQRLGISAPSVSEMLQRMVEEQLLTTTSRGHYTLTEEGRKAGEKVVRRHRLLERLLVDVLEMDWGLAHEEACRLEHGMSQEMEDSLDRRLGHPQTCPHGNPIPGENEEAPPSPLTLANLAKEVAATIVCIHEEEQHFLRYLASLGIFPGASVEVLEIGPFSATRLVSVAGCRYSLGEEILRKIVVQPVIQPRLPALVTAA
jgi:DtxR family Mn-dependent transcriptional regulator